MTTMDDDALEPGEIAVRTKDSEAEEAAVFTVHPGCRALIVPFWMIEKILVDFSNGPGELVVQLKKEDEIEREKNEGN